jgi:hypothetical protein
MRGHRLVRVVKVSWSSAVAHISGVFVVTDLTWRDERVAVP